MGAKSTLKILYVIGNAIKFQIQIQMALVQQWVQTWANSTVHTSANDPKRKVQPDFFLCSFGTLGCFIVVLLNIVKDRFLDLSPYSSSLGSIIIFVCSKYLFVSSPCTLNVKNCLILFVVDLSRLFHTWKGSKFSIVLACQNEG